MRRYESIKKQQEERSILADFYLLFKEGVGIGPKENDKGYSVEEMDWHKVAKSIHKL